MFFFSKPKKSEIDSFLSGCVDDSLSYAEIGISKSGSPDGYITDHNRIMIGNGRSDFERAKDAVRGWKMFDFSWVELCWPDVPIETGQNVAVLVRHFEIYSLNAARIVYVIDEPNRFGFAYGTLTDHAESGEERFTVEFNPETNEVHYDLFAFSKLNHPFAKLASPLARMLQKNFAANSKTAMLHAVQPSQNRMR